MAQKKSKKLNPKQVLAAEMLGQGYRQKEVAERLDLRVETISRWTALEPFRAAIDEANRDLIAAISGDTNNLINKCHETILAALNSNETASLRASIALRYLNTYVKPHSVYEKLAEAQKSKETRSEFDEILAQLWGVVKQLGYLKSSNSVYTDREYREKAEEIVRSWGKIDPNFQP